jgi:hypothetical protein
MFLGKSNGDILNLTRRATEIANGSFIFNYPDPPLRNIPLAGLIAIYRLAGLPPISATITYTVLLEFIVTPIAFWYLLTKITPDKRIHTASLLLYSLFLFHFPPWPNTAFFFGTWMYAFAVPPALLAVAGTLERRYLFTGLMLGIIALLQAVIAVAIAAVIGVALLLQRDIRGLIVTATVSAITAIPSFIAFALFSEKWLSRGAGRAQPGPGPLFSTREIAAILVIGIAVSVGLYLLWNLPELRNRLIHESPLVLLVAFTMIGGGTAVSLFILDSFWYRYLLGYLFKFLFLISAGIWTVVSIDWYLSLSGGSKTLAAIRDQS